jgi:protein-arginine kinase activator protein McsA
MPIITEGELQTLEAEHKKRKYKKKIKPEEFEEVITDKNELKLFWKSPSNFEAIKKVCANYGMDWKNISDENRVGIMNIILKEK